MILQLDPTNLPKNYKVVANVPYYITGKIISKFSEVANPPSRMKSYSSKKKSPSAQLHTLAHTASPQLPQVSIT